MLRIGLISDTHNRLDPLLAEVFGDVSFIIHAGDICEPSILQALEGIAPVHAVRGNNDHHPGLMALPESRVIEVDSLRILVAHDAKDPRMSDWIRDSSPFLIVVGHSHKPSLGKDGGIYRVNPGSAGPKRFSNPRTAGTLVLCGPQAPEVQLWDLAANKPYPLKIQNRLRVQG